jgi:hypothetical protein
VPPSKEPLVLSGRPNASALLAAIEVRKDRLSRPPSLRTVQANLPHTALRSMVRLQKDWADPNLSRCQGVPLSPPIASAPSHGDALMFGHGPESACLTRTLTLLTMDAHGRTPGGPRWVSHIGARHRRAPMCLRVQPRASYRRHQRRFANRPYAVHGNRVDGRNDHTLPNVEGKNNRHYLQPANANRVEPKPVVGLPSSAAGCPGAELPHPTGDPAGRPFGAPRALRPGWLMRRRSARRCQGDAPRRPYIAGRGAGSYEPRAFPWGVKARRRHAPCPNARGAGGA